MDISKKNLNRLSLECKIHEKNDPQYLYLSSKEENILLCNKCIDLPKYSDVELSQFQQIQNLLDQDDQTILHKWPPIQNQKLLRKMQEYFLNSSCEIIDYKDIIFSHFEQIQKTFHYHIEEIKKQTLVKYDALPKLQDEFFNLYNQMAEKENIKDILLNPDNDFDQTQSKLKNILIGKEKQKQDNEIALLRIFNLHKEYTQLLNQENLGMLREQLMNTLKALIYFPLRESQTNFDNVLQNNSSIQDQIQLSQQKQLQQQLLEKLANHMDRIQKQSQNQFQMKEFYYPQTQAILRQIQNCKYINEITEVIYKYPIFEMVNFSQEFIVVEQSCSKLTIIRKALSNKEVQFTKKNYNNWKNSIVSDLPLFKDSTYIIQFEVKLEYSISSLCIALSNRIKPQLKGSCFDMKIFKILGYTKILNAETKGIDVVTKGSEENLTKHSSFQLKINLTKGLFQISDYPDFENIIENNHESIESLQEQQQHYYLTFSLFAFGDYIKILSFQQLKDNI